MGAPRVSVVIPTRDRAGVLPRAIRSALAQTFGDLEVIVVDDASTDGTPGVVQELAARDARVRAVRSDRAAGASAARNRGIALARGEFVAFLDDDDEWLPEKLERQLPRAEGGADVVCSPYLFVDAEGREHVRGTAELPGDARATLLGGNTVATPTVLARREALLEEGGFDESLHRLEDWELWLRMARSCRFASVPEPLVRVHFTPASLSSRRPELIASAEGLLRRHAGSGASPEDRAQLFYAVGHALVFEGVTAEGRALMLRSLRTRPWPPQRFVMAAATLLGRRGYAGAVRVHLALLELAWRWKRPRPTGAPAS